jgi:hypothetical protein
MFCGWCTDLSTLTLGWSQSTNLTVTRPDPAFPFILRFTPRVNWFGDAPVWLSIFQVVDGVFTNPVSIGITIRVKNVPTPPTFHFPNISSPGAVGSGYIYERTEGFAPWTVDFTNIVQYYDGTGFNLFLYPTEFPEPSLAEQRKTANGPIVNGGKIVTFGSIQTIHAIRIITVLTVLVLQQWTIILLVLSAQLLSISEWQTSMMLLRLHCFHRMLM